MKRSILALMALSALVFCSGQRCDLSPLLGNLNISGSDDDGFDDDFDDDLDDDLDDDFDDNGFDDNGFDDDNGVGFSSDDGSLEGDVRSPRGGVKF